MLKGIHANQEGMSLPEVLITVVISGILTLAGATIINLAAQYYAVSVNKIQAEIEASRGLYVLKTVLAQAVDIRRVAGPVVGPGAGPADDRRVRGEFVAGNLGGTAGAITNVAVFNRETALGDGTSVIRPTGITFVGPNRDGANDDIGGAVFVWTYGAGLNISNDYNTTTTLSADDANSNIVTIPRVVRFQARAADMRGITPGAANPVVNSPPAVGDMLVSMQVNLTFRFHRTHDPQTWCWDPNLGSGYCTGNNLGGQDVVKSTTINFRNNRIYATNNDDPTFYPKSDYRLNGGLYFFQPRTARPPF